MARYLDSENERAVNAYCDLAESNDMTPSELALSWCYHNEHVASTIIGATTEEQLIENLKAYDIKLDGMKSNSKSATTKTNGESDDDGDDESATTILDEIEQIYKRYPDPTK